MTKKTAKPAPAAPTQSLAQRNQRAAARGAVRGANAALNAQSRRVLAQHYRAKYGVK